MASEISYIFGDILTGDIIEEIRLFSASFSTTLNSGELRASFQLDQTGKDNESLVSATIPGRCYCVVERNGQVVGDYILRTRTYQSQSKSFQLYGVAWKSYTDSRFITEDYEAEDVEQRDLLVDLYEILQADPNSARVNLPATAFPIVVPRSLSISASEKKTFRQVIDSFADTPDGFDWLVRTHREGNTYDRSLEIWYPQIGALDDGLNIFEYIHTAEGPGGNIINYWANDTMGSAGTHFYGIGAGEGEDMIASTIIDTALLTGGFPRYDVDFARKDIDDQTRLDDLTAQHAAIHRAPASVITAEVKVNVGDVVDNIGDACRLIIKDPRFPNTFERATRILGIEYYPPDNSNVEFVRYTFEGEE